MLSDSTFIQNGSDIVVGNVQTLPSVPTVNTMVYLVQQDGSNAPGLYFYNENLAWLFLSNGAVVTD